MSALIDWTKMLKQFQTPCMLRSVCSHFILYFNGSRI